jgi:hypothetical protein
VLDSAYGPNPSLNTVLNYSKKLACLSIVMHESAVHQKIYFPKECKTKRSGRNVEAVLPGYTNTDQAKCLQLAHELERDSKAWKAIHEAFVEEILDIREESTPQPTQRESRLTSLPSRSCRGAKRSGSDH